MILMPVLYNENTENVHVGSGVEGQKGTFWTEKHKKRQKSEDFPVFRKNLIMVYSIQEKGE